MDLEPRSNIGNLSLNLTILQKQSIFIGFDKLAVSEQLLLFSISREAEWFILDGLPSSLVIIMTITYKL